MAGMPLYQLFGGKCRAAIPCYTHAEGDSVDVVLERVAALKELGYRKIRVQVGGYGGKNPSMHRPENSPPGAYFDPKSYIRNVLNLMEILHVKYGGELEFCHNPFSMPQGGMDALLNKDPLDILAYQYDIVVNGVELSSGAVRNHDPEIMIKAFELVRLGEEDVKKKFPAMYNAFCYGAPPHAGIAPGVDRMVMLLAGESSIREIIPFPMNKNAQDIMMGAPSTVEQKQLDELHIAIVGEVEED